MANATAKACTYGNLGRPRPESTDKNSDSSGEQTLLQLDCSSRSCTEPRTVLIPAPFSVPYQYGTDTVPALIRYATGCTRAKYREKLSRTLLYSTPYWMNQPVPHSVRYEHGTCRAMVRSAMFISYRTPSVHVGYKVRFRPR